MTTSRTLGAVGEELAARLLQARGIEVQARNWRCRYGELDIIARDGDTIVFVEVKTRSSTGFGVAEAVTVAKQQRIRRLALLWLAQRQGPWVPIRFDVVAVVAGRDCSRRPDCALDTCGCTVEHLKAVF